MDLISLLAHSPSWVQWVFNALLNAYVVATLVANVSRMIPAEQYTRIEANVPRLAWAFRGFRKFGTDVWPSLQSFGRAVVGAVINSVNVTFSGTSFASSSDVRMWVKDAMDRGLARSTTTPPEPVELKGNAK